MDMYAPDPDATALGTNLDQFLTGSEAIRQSYGEDFDAFGRIGNRDSCESPLTCSSFVSRFKMQTYGSINPAVHFRAL